MALIGIRSSVAGRQKRLSLEKPGPPVPDGDGGYTRDPIPLDPPAVWGHVRPASARDLERIAGATTLPTATHLVTIPYHAQVTTETVVQMEAHPLPPRALKVVYLGNPDERNAELELICAEQVT